MKQPFKQFGDEKVLSYSFFATFKCASTNRLTFTRTCNIWAGPVERKGVPYWAIRTFLAELTASSPAYLILCVI